MAFDRPNSDELTPPAYFDELDARAEAANDGIDARVPPHDRDAEDAVIAAVIADPSAFAQVGELKPEDFYSEANRQIFQACQNLRAAGISTDIRNVAAELKKHDRLAQVGGVGGITEILEGTGLHTSVARYAETLIEKARARALLFASQKATAFAYAGASADDIRAELLADIEKQKSGSTAPPWESLVTPLDPAWMANAPPARQWLLRDVRRPKRDGVLPMGKAAQLVAEGGIGKTMAMIQLAIAKATGADWLGTFSTGDPGDALVLLGEEDAAEVQRRVYNAARTKDGRPVSAGSVVVLPLCGVQCALLERDERGNTRETAFCGWLRDYVSRRPWSLIIIDPLSRFASVDTETENAQGTRFVQVIESFAALTGATVLVAHHTNAVSRGPGASVRGGRGVTSLGDGFRWVASLTATEVDLEGEAERERLGEVVTLRSVKTNYSRKFEPVVLRRLDGGPFVPLDETDLALVEQAAGVDAAKVERERARTDAEESAHDEAVMRAVREHPGISRRDLITRVRALVRCGQPKAEIAIARVRTRLDVKDGPRNAQFHFLKGAAT
jgi:RecA-family ATPase